MDEGAFRKSGLPGQNTDSRVHDESEPVQPLTQAGRKLTADLVPQLDWDRLEKLRAPHSLSIALSHLGIFNLYVVRRELRSDGDRKWIPVPMWLKGSHPFVERIEKNEVGSEILRSTREDVMEESYRLQDTVFKTNALGLTEMVVPLVLRGERLGFVGMGGFVIEDPVPAEVVLEERFKILMLSAEDRRKAILEYRTLPRFSSDKRVIVTQMLQVLTREVSQFFEEALSLREREEAVNRHTFNQMVTANHPLRSMLKKIPQFAQGDTPILINGELGTGRELLAEMIHQRSARSSGAFRTLHCSSIAENLIEAELRGYEKNAFPGAYETKEGLFELCRGGTLYLKEIGDLSLAMQYTILRLIQEKVFTRVGGKDNIQTDVRIVASTQRNLKKLVQMGAFREELYFRLNVVELELPALRQRKEDIPILAEHFIQYFMKVMGKEGIQWKEDALIKLQTHGFPGNVRELRNEVERIVAMKESHSFVEVKDLSSKIIESLSPIEEIEKGLTLKSLVDTYEKGIISEALNKYHWNKSRVAELFQITRQGLLKKIAKYKLDKRKRP